MICNLIMWTPNMTILLHFHNHANLKNHLHKRLGHHLIYLFSPKKFNCSYTIRLHNDRMKTLRSDGLQSINNSPNLQHQWVIHTTYTPSSHITKLSLMIPQDSSQSPHPNISSRLSITRQSQNLWRGLPSKRIHTSVTCHWNPTTSIIELPIPSNSLTKPWMESASTGAERPSPQNTT